MKQMGSIYATAAKVLVWLGLDPFGYSDKEESMALPAGRFFHVLDVKANSLGFSSIIQLQMDNLDHNTYSFWQFFTELINRPWFSRLGVLQEVDLGKSVVALFENTQVGFDNLMSLLAVCNPKGLSQRTIT